MRLDLGRVSVEFEPELGHELARQRLPVDCGVRGEMRVVIAYGAVDLARQLHFREQGASTLEARHDIGHFLAQGRRCRRLPMRSSQHRQGSVIVREYAQIAYQ